MKEKNNSKKPGAKGFSMIRKIVFGVLILGISAWAVEDSVEAVDESRLDRIEKTVRKVISKAGINIGGEFRSQFLLSRVKGNAVEKNYRKDENVEYTSVDFDISARPNTALQGRLIFRLHQDWRNFFSSLKSPVFARWISIDGLVKNVFSYSIGDFKQKYTPLTLYSPDIDIAYEPEIFAKLRRQAMNEVFLGDNERVLQGVNFNFDAEIVPIFKEFHFNLLGTRLRLAGVGTESMVADEVETSRMDKYLLGTNINMEIFPDLLVGGTVLDIFDSRYTFHGSSQDSATILKQQTLIHAQRLGFGTAPFIDPEKFNIAVNGELAWSFDDSLWWDSDSIFVDTVFTGLDSTLGAATTKGTAWTVDLSTHIGLGSAGNLDLTFGYLRNGVHFRNELAQSPTLLYARIMNSENDPVTGALYSTFDVLYRHVFKFCPSQNAFNLGWFKGPMSKSGYTNGLLTYKELSATWLDPSLYLVMPYGPATPNRKGIQGELSGDFIEKAIVFSITAKYLNEINGWVGQPDLTDSTLFERFPEAKFYEMCGGLSLDIAKLGDWWPYPFIFSGSYRQSNASSEEVTGYPTSAFVLNVDLINAGLYWTFWKRASLLGGFQYLKNTYNNIYSIYPWDVKEIHWVVGLEYKVAEGGTITGSFGFNDVTYSDEADEVLGTDASQSNFRQWQTDLFLTVNF